MTRADLILRCMLVYNQHAPPPPDVNAVHVRPMATNMAQARYENMATYIDQQLDLHKPTEVDISKCPTLLALTRPA